MTFRIVPQSYNAGDIIHCARSMWGWSQGYLVNKCVDVAITQSTLSRIENGKSTPSISEWVALTRALEIPMDSICYGSIDTISFKNIAEKKKSSIFPPKRYLENACIKNRALLPLFKYMENKFDAPTITNIFNTLKIDRLYFFCLDNSINLQFLSDLLKRIIIEKSLYDQTSQLVSNISKNIHYTQCHGKISELFDQSFSPTDKIKKFIDLSPHYQTLFIQRVVQQEQNILKFHTTLNPKYHKIFETLDLQIIELIQKLLNEYAKEMSYFQTMNNIPSYKTIAKTTPQAREYSSEITLQIQY